MPEQLPLSTVSVALTGPPAWQSWADSSGHEKGEHLLNSEMRPGCRDRAPTVDWPSSNLLLLLLSLVRGPLGFNSAQLPEGGNRTGPGPSVAAAAAPAPKAPGQRLGWAPTGREYGSVPRGKGGAGPLGSAPQRQVLALSHGPGIGEWREGRTHPGKAGSRARCMRVSGESRGRAAKP